MDPMEEILSEIRRKKEAEQGFGNQFIQGAERGASLGYFGDDMPKNLPLTGRIGRIAGDIAGTLPAFAGATAGLGALGITGLASEIASGAAYGYFRKPEDAESRIHNAMTDAALFGGGYVGLKTLGKMFGRGAEGVGKGLEGEIPAPGAATSEGVHTIEDLVRTKNAEQGVMAQTPEDAISAMGREFTGGRGEPPPPPGAPPPSHPAFEAPTTQEEVGRFGIPLTPEEKIQNRGREFTRPPRPENMAKVAEVQAWDSLAKPWAQDIQNGVSKSEELAADAMTDPVLTSRAAARKAIRDAGKHNLGESPPTAIQAEKPLPLKVEENFAMQQEIDQIVKKNALPLEVLQVATQVKEPVNFLMSKGVNFEDANRLHELLLRRAKSPSIEEMAVKKPMELLGTSDPVEQAAREKLMFGDIDEQTHAMAKGCPE